MDERLKEKLYVHTIEYYSESTKKKEDIQCETIWMKLESICTK
jgi:hypothetical protein